MVWWDHKLALPNVADNSLSQEKTMIHMLLLRREILIKKRNEHLKKIQKRKEKRGKEEIRKSFEQVQCDEWR